MGDNIRNKFVELIDCLKDRESELLRDLDNLLASYLSYRDELDRVDERKRDLETKKPFNRNQLSTSTDKSILENIISQLNTEINSIVTPKEPKMFSFECDSNKMLAELNKLGKLVEKGGSDDYKSKKQPLVSVCQKGKGMEQLAWPRDVTVDNKTGNIFITDQHNNCVKIFDSTGKYLFNFGDNEVEGKMYLPLCVAIYGDRILISQGNNCIMNYQLNGMFISKIGKQGKGKLEFNWPNGLTIDGSNGNIYVSDCQNYRIQVLSQKFRFKSQFGKDILRHPRDIKLSKQYIYVIDESNPCLHLFNYNHILQKSVITRGHGMEVLNPYYFFVDQTDEILISDSNSNFIYIFDNEFHLFHKISVSFYPMGVTVDNKGRIIVVCQTGRNCLQIF